MNLINVLPLFLLIFSLPATASPEKVINESNLYGEWLCKEEMVDPKSQMKIQVSYNIHYAKNGKSNGMGTVIFNIEGLPPLEYAVTDNSTWKIEGESLMMSSTEINFVNVSFPELDNLLNLKQILPKSINESAQLLELTDANIKVKSASTGGIYTCSKVVP